MNNDIYPRQIQNFLTWQARKNLQPEEKIKKPEPFVTISREYGCQGCPLARALEERLNAISSEPTPWVVMGKEVIENINKKEGKAAEFAEALSSGRRGIIRQTVEVLISGHPTELRAYESLAETLISLAGAGRVILLGRGGACVCGEVDSGFHIRLVAPLRWRAEKIGSEGEIATIEAKSITINEEKRREAFVREFLGTDVTDPLNYDIVINNMRNSVESIADMCVLGMKKKGII